MSTSASQENQLIADRKMRAKFTHFRILIIGRANAGKTTILRKLCNATGEPMIFRPNGEKIESSTLDPTVKRGEHNIENEMIFEGNPGFVFHDSRGFEAGGARELKLVREFINQRSRTKDMEKQLHAIWYCIPTTDDRPITKAEKIFFDECGTGLVPVIVLWTKTDSLDWAKIEQLIEEGVSESEAIQQAPEKAWADFEKNTQQHFDRFKYPPKAFVALRKMHEPGADCKDLIGKTTGALSNEDLQWLLLSTQQVDLELCIIYGVKRVLGMGKKQHLKYFGEYEGNLYFIRMILLYFPQLVLDDFHLDDDFFDDDFFHDFRLDHLDDDFFHDFRLDQNTQSIPDIMSFVLHGLSSTFNLKEVTYCVIVTAIVGHLSFFIHQDSPTKKNSLRRAAHFYQQSTCDTSVRGAVEKIFQLENTFTDKFLNLFKGSHIQVDHELLVKEATQAALNNLISLKDISSFTMI